MLCEINRHWAAGYWTIEQLSTSLFCFFVYGSKREREGPREQNISLLYRTYFPALASRLSQSCPQQTLRRTHQIQSYHRYGPERRGAFPGIAENEKADEWAELAADKSGGRGVEWLRFGDRYGRQAIPLPASLAHLKRHISKKKQPEAITRPRRRLSSAVHKPRYRQRVNPFPDKTDKRAAGRRSSARPSDGLAIAHIGTTAGCDSDTWQTKEPLCKNFQADGGNPLLSDRSLRTNDVRLPSWLFFFGCWKTDSSSSVGPVAGA